MGGDTAGRGLRSVPSTYAVVDGIGGNLGVIVMALALAAILRAPSTCFRAALRSMPTNVNEAWDESGGIAHEPAVPVVATSA